VKAETKRQEIAANGNLESVVHDQLRVMNTFKVWISYSIIHETLKRTSGANINLVN